MNKIRKKQSSFILKERKFLMIEFPFRLLTARTQWSLIKKQLKSSQLHIKRTLPLQTPHYLLQNVQCMEKIINSVFTGQSNLKTSTHLDGTLIFVMIESSIAKNRYIRDIQNSSSSQFLYEYILLMIKLPLTLVSNSWVRHWNNQQHQLVAFVTGLRILTHLHKTLTEKIIVKGSASTELFYSANRL